LAQHELFEAGPLLDDQGSLRKRGWSRRPVLSYERAAIDAPVHRISELDRFLAFSKDNALSVSVADDGYTGAVCATIVDLQEGTHVSQSYQIRLPFGSLSLPASSEKGDTKYRNKACSLDFAIMEGGARIVKIDFPDFGHGNGLRGALVLSAPCSADVPEESLITLRSWRKDPLAFSYNRVQPTFFAEGMMQGADAELVFANKESFAILDWRRSVRPRADLRFWGAASGLVGDAHFGFSIGYGTEDDDASTENAIFYNGKLHKLGTVTFQINPRDYLAPWRFTSDDGRLEMELHPHVERTEKSRVLFYSAKRRQVFGYYSGKAILDDGRSLAFSNMPGIAERLRTRG